MQSRKYRRSQSDSALHRTFGVERFVEGALGRALNAIQRCNDILERSRTCSKRDDDALAKKYADILIPRKKSRLENVFFGISVGICIYIFALLCADGWTVLLEWFAITRNPNTILFVYQAKTTTYHYDQYVFGFMLLFICKCFDVSSTHHGFTQVYKVTREMRWEHENNPAVRWLLKRCGLDWGLLMILSLAAIAFLGLGLVCISQEWHLCYVITVALLSVLHLVLAGGNYINTQRVIKEWQEKHQVD